MGWTQSGPTPVLARTAHLGSTAPGGGRSLLRSLRVEGHDGDLFGNGLPSVLQMNGQVRYWRNLVDLDGDGVIDAISGWQVYDNKGRVVVSYEPYFDTGWDYVPPSARRLAGELRKVTTFYDPRGDPVRTAHPDGSQDLTVHGVPDDLTAPATYRPTAWETYRYDVNDNAGRTHPAESTGYAAHWNTPHSTVLDALGRVVQATERLQGGRTLTTRTSYDIDGNILTVTDPLGRTISRAAHDLLNRAWRSELIDAGRVRTVLDPLSVAVEHREGHRDRRRLEPRRDGAQDHGYRYDLIGNLPTGQPGRARPPVHLLPLHPGSSTAGCARAAAASCGRATPRPHQRRHVALDLQTVAVLMEHRQVAEREAVTVGVHPHQRSFLRQGIAHRHHP